MTPLQCFGFVNSLPLHPNKCCLTYPYKWQFPQLQACQNLCRISGLGPASKHGMKGICHLSYIAPLDWSTLIRVKFACLANKLKLIKDLYINTMAFLHVHIVMIYMVPWLINLLVVYVTSSPSLLMLVEKYGGIPCERIHSILLHPRDTRKRLVHSWWES